MPSFLEIIKGEREDGSEYLEEIILGNPAFKARTLPKEESWILELFQVNGTCEITELKLPIPPEVDVWVTHYTSSLLTILVDFLGIRSLSSRIVHSDSTFKDSNPMYSRHLATHG